jgi:methylated-DNA-[protein]-cysteine S-methyltransferase
MPNSSYCLIETPVGPLTLTGRGNTLTSVLWGEVRPDNAISDDPHPLLREAESQLHSYFESKLTHFAIPLVFQGTEFQKKVWNALLEIPYGDIRTYGEIATRIQHPAAVRAVGAAIGKNPFAILVPCHRVIGRSGELTGFAGGLKAKAHLLGLERSFS